MSDDYETVRGRVKQEIEITDDDAIERQRWSVYDDEDTEIPVCDIIEKSGKYALVELADNTDESDGGER